MATLKKKEFIAKVKDLNVSCVSSELIWICANYSTKGDQSGWVVGFTENGKEQCVLVTDKGLLRTFKTIDAAVDFVAINGLSDGSVNIAYA